MSNPENGHIRRFDFHEDDIKVVLDPDDNHRWEFWFIETQSRMLLDSLGLVENPVYWHLRAIEQSILFKYWTVHMQFDETAYDLGGK